MTVGIRNPLGGRSMPGGAAVAIARPGAHLIAVAIGVIGLMWLLGSWLVSDTVPTFLRRADTQSSAWVADHRTAALNGVTHVGSMMADTIIALVVTTVAVVVLRVWLGRWRESLVTVIAVVGELLIFLVITATVHRARPAVPQLDQAPPTSSFPSGHTGAAMALYGCLAVILLRNVKPRWVAVGLAVIGFTVPILVAASRVYRGMHYPTDVLAGAIASGIWLLAVVLVLLRPDRRPHRSRSTSSPESVA